MIIENIVKTYLAENGRVATKTNGRWTSIVEASKVKPDLSIFNVFADISGYYEGDGFKIVGGHRSQGVLKLERYGNKYLVTMTIYKDENFDARSLRITFRDPTDEDSKNHLLRF